MKNPLMVIQIIVSFLIIVFILLQSKGTGLGSAFGGSGEFYRSKRGVEKIVYNATVILLVIFAASSLLLAMNK